MKFPNVGGGQRQGGQAPGLFIKMKDGDRITGAFRGDPAIHRVHWVGGRSSVCAGRDDCKLCQEGDKAKFRFKLNLVSKVDGVWVARIFEGSYQTYKDLKELHESDYNLEETLVSIARKGEGTDTRYTVLPVKNNGGLTSKDFAALSKVPLNQLKDADPGEPGPVDAPENDEAPPF